MLQLAIGRGVDGYGVDIQLLAGPKNAQRDLAAIGDEHLFQHGHVYSSAWAGRPELNDGNQRLVEFNRLAVLNQYGLHGAGLVGLYLVHHLHGFHNAENVPHLDALAHFTKR